MRKLINTAKYKTTGIILCCLFSVFFAVAQDLPAVYQSPAQTSFVKIWTANAPDQDQDHLITRPLRDVKLSTQYIDGLGRVIETVDNQGSLITSTGATEDLVTPLIYDAYGRETEKFLPFVANTNDGSFKYNPFYKQSYFYGDNTNGPIKNQGETYYYNKTDYEASNLERPVKNYPAGNNWLGSSRGSDIQYLTNTANDAVQMWDVNITTGAYSSLGSYPAGALLKTVTRDENGMETDEFKDMADRTILKKVQVGGSAWAAPVTPYIGWLCTYYIYDDLGNLRCVVQPRGVEMISSNWVLTDPNILNEECFQYNYDGRNRVIMKKIPGAGAVNMVYDAKDRLVMTQDANLAALNKWLVTLYDNLERPVQTGLLQNTYSLISGLTVAQIQANAAASASYPFTESTIPSSTYWEKLTAIHYDDYTNLPSGLSATLNTTYITSSNFITTYNASPDYAQQITQATQTTGKVTWTQSEILGSIQYISQANFYDERGSLVQTQTLNQTNGVDIATTQYDFAGKVLRTHLLHQKNTTPGQNYQIATKNLYDDLGRAIEVDKNFNNAGYITISTEQYNAIGQLIKKTIGSKKDPNTQTYYTTRQEIDEMNYDYNIRGWLLGVNRPLLSSNGSGAQNFSFELGYDKNTNSSGRNFTSTQYNGNITGMIWKTNGDGVRRKYDFGYDPANRFMQGIFEQNDPNTSNWGSSLLNYTVKMGATGADVTTAYDANGNIKRMQQWGLKIGGSSQIDDLTYNYMNSGGSNKLLNVADAFNDNTTKLGDFRVSALNPVQTKTTTTVDYTYDANGNLVTDLNKDIIPYAGGNGIQYNYLNLPTVITIKNATGNKGTITYTYDANGTKLQKTVLENNASVTYNGTPYTTNITTTTNYISGFVYESKAYSNSSLAALQYTDVLQFTSQEEGRIRRKPNGTFVYDYYLKDHLGNVRMMLTDDIQIDIYPVATLETSNRSLEQTYYNITTSQIVASSSVTGLPAYQNHNVIPTNPVNATFDNASSAQVYKLNKNSQSVGLGITLKVMSGDKLDIYGKSYYFQNNTGGSGANTDPTTLAILTAFLGGPTGSIANVHGSVSASQLNSMDGTALTALLNNETTQNNGNTQIPKAFINWILFDEQFNYVTSNFAPVGNNSSLTDYAGTAALHNISVTKNGFIFIFCSNASPVDVFFDNLQVMQTRGPIMEETHYYPFGLTMAGISSQSGSSLENKFKYNGKEFQHKEFSDGGGLEGYDFGARMQDPQLGRWQRIDPKSDSYEAASPYEYTLNDPIDAIDPDGRLIIFVNGFMFEQWQNQDNSPAHYVSPIFDENGSMIMKGYTTQPRQYPGERTFATGSPTYLGEHFPYWGNEIDPKAGIGGLISQAYQDYNTRFISASAAGNSQAPDRFLEGEKAGEDLIKQLDNGTITLGKDETIKIVGHSQGAAFAAGIVSILAKNAKYSKRVEIAIYLAPHQPKNFSTPNNIKSMQWSTDLDWIADSKISWPLMNILNGGSENGKINGVDEKDYHLRASRSKGKGGHYVDTYLDDLLNYYQNLGIPVNEE